MGEGDCDVDDHCIGNLKCGQDGSCDDRFHTSWSCCYDDVDEG